jgi:putative nucleotidyltransferase with HDIG domain
MHDTVAIEDLKIGMYIHLEGGWMSHPFPVSSFRIGSGDEIRRIRELGLRQVRWSRDKSTLTDLAAPPAPTGAPAAAESATPAPAMPTAAALHRALLDAQREAARRCENQFNEAAQTLRQAVADVRDKPDAAREASMALARTLHEKMLGDEQLCVRVLSSQAGEKPTAHALNVTVIAMLMGRLLSLDEPAMLALGTGALLHDMGKLELPHRVHHHDEGLSAVEVRAYREHVQLGVQLAQRMKLPAAAVQVIEQHHEDGGAIGFPQQLSVERMSEAARIVALVNRYDELCNPHNLARAMTPHEALSRLFAQGRGKGDTTMLGAFIRMMGVYPAGSVVQLTDERFAVVTQVNASRPLKPQVLIHDPAVPREQALLVNLLNMPELGIRRSLHAAQLPEAARRYLAPAPRLAYFFETAPAPESKDEAWL